MVKFFLISFVMSFNVILLSGCSSAPVQVKAPQLSYSYSTLKLLDLEQMTELIQQKIHKYTQTGNDEVLQEALMICLARPDSDSLVEKLIENIRYSVETNNQWESAVRKVVQRGIDSLHDPSTATEDQMGYLIALENLIAEFRPEFIKQYKSPGFETRIIEQISRADIEVSKQADSESRLNLMVGRKSPSEIADELMEERTVALKAR
jgi:hypothetical protein